MNWIDEIGCSVVDLDDAADTAAVRDDHEERRKDDDAAAAAADNDDDLGRGGEEDYPVEVVGLWMDSDDVVLSDV